jgi:acrylyl-CoA reductase (NADPH)
MSSYTAVVLQEPGPAQLVQLTDDDLPGGDVTVDVQFSSLNYKDGLAVSGKGKIARSLPMTCGIDFAGVVASSDSADFAAGDEVIATGWGMSETRPGGYTGRQRVAASMLTRRPDSLTLSQSMAIGTAGLTSMLCVLALEAAGLTTETDGEVIVTGAAGGVGSVAVAILSTLGYTVAASTGRPEAHDYLRSLGATTIVDRADLATAGRPLDKERWAAGIDSVGSQTLATVLAQTRYRGSVAACGLAGGNDLPTTVLPFILRGVSLLGIDSVQTDIEKRRSVWRRLGADLKPRGLDEIGHDIGLDDLDGVLDSILEGKVTGRYVVDVRR